MDIRHIKNFGQVISFCDLDNVPFDLYCYPGYPHDIHDNYGSLAVEEFFNRVICKLECYNEKVYRVSTSVFAIPYDNNNPMTISINYKLKTYELNRRTVTINNVHNSGKR